MTQSIDLSSTEWREENLSTLQEWHPAFNEIHSDMELLLTQFKGVMERYRTILVNECSEPPEWLLAHVHEEMMVWYADRMDAILQELWKQ